MAAQNQGSPPAEWKFFDLQNFGGLDTRSPRQTINDDDFAWLENFIPIAPGNLRTMWGKGSSIFTASAGRTIVYFKFYVLNGVSYAFVVLDNGTGYQVKTSDGTQTTISSTVGTFYSGGTIPQATQWGSQYLQIVTKDTTNGYFIWDGTSLYKAGTLGPAVLISSGGVGYSSTPSVNFFGGSGSGATGTATITNGAVTSIAITNPGSSYLVTDGTILVQVTGGGLTSKVAKLTAVLTAGAVSSITIVDGGSGYTSAPTITFSGGGGAGASVTATISGGAINGFTGLVGGSGYTSAPTVLASGGGNPAAYATVSLMPFGVAGSTIENFQQRAFIANGIKILFSVAGDPANFGASAGGGVFQSSDGFLKTQFTSLAQQSSYLYTFADSSANQIGQPSTTNNITTFSNTNIDTQIGTPWRDSVTAYGLALFLGNSSGFYSCIGGAMKKESEPLDGVFASATLPGLGTGIPSAVATVFGIKILIYLMTVLDPFTNTQVPKLICYDQERKKWFVASQEVTLTYIGTQEVNSVLTAWGTDGTNLFPLFAQPSATLVKKGLTKLWNGDSYLWKKQFLRVYSQAFDNSGTGASITYTVNTEQGSTSAVSLLSVGSMNFVNNSGGVLQFQNGSSGNLNFTSSGVAIALNGTGSVFGNLMGLQFTSSSADFTIAAMSIAYQNYTYLM